MQCGASWLTSCGRSCQPLLQPTLPLTPCLRATRALVPQKVLEDGNPNFGYNAATGKFEDLMEAGIIDPAKVNKQAAAMLRLVGPCWVEGLADKMARDEAGIIDPAKVNTQPAAKLRLVWLG